MKRLAAIACWALLVAKAGAATQTVNYAYDGANRLISAVYDGTSGIHYTYDASGNRTRQIVVGPGNPQADYNTNGLYDLWELTHFGDITNDPGADLDNDNYNNESESRSWTNPTNTLSHLQFNTLTNIGGIITIVWEADPRIRYRVWWTEILDGWNTTNSITNSIGYWTDNQATNQRYYRVTVDP